MSETRKLLLSSFLTPANSFVGMSLLTMPFCFKQCGMILAIFMLILCNILSRRTCYFLIKSATQNDKRSFVLLASHAFGQTGRILAQLLIIGFMLGTCVANFVTLADLISHIFIYITGWTILDIGEYRILAILTLLMTAFRLGLNQNIAYVFKICPCNTIIYSLITMLIMIRSFLVIYLDKKWADSINYWRLDGIFQCLPIFFMASFCHIQLLEIYQMMSSPGSKLKLLNNVAKKVINRCTCLYIIIGFLGYISFYNTQSLTGNHLMSHEPNVLSELIIAGFVSMIVTNFPLVIFTCRNNLDSLLRCGITTDVLFVSYLSKFRCCCLTILIVISSMIITIRMPSLEFVLNIMGWTIGGMMFIFPAAIFICTINRSNLSQRLLSYFYVIFGVCFMALYMHANFYPMEESTNTKSTDIVLNSISPSLNNISDDLHMNLNVSNNLTLDSGTKNKINNLQKSNVLNETVSTLKDDIEVSIAKPMIDEKKRSAEESDKTAVNSLMPRTEVKVETLKILNENLNAVDSGTIDKINNLQKHNVLNETVSTLKDDIEVSITKPMIDEEKQSAEESDKTAVNSLMPRKEVKVETLKILNENLNAVDSGTIVSTLKDDIKVSTLKPMIDEEKQSAEKSDKAAVNSNKPKEEVKVETFKTLNENLNAVDSGTKDKINNLQKHNVLNETVSTLKDDIEISIAKPMIDEEKQSTEESDEATVNSFMSSEELKVETFKTLNENLNAVDSGTIVSTLKDDIKVSTLKPMIDEEKHSAEKSDKAAVNSVMPEEEIKVEKKKTLYENLNAVYSKTIDRINNLPNVINEALSTLKDGIKVSILKPMIDQEEQSAEESDKAAVTSVMPEEEIKVEKKKTLNENIIVTQITVDIKSSKIDESVTLKAKDEVNIIKEKDQPVNLQKKSKGNLYSFKESSWKNNMETSQEISGNNVHYFLRVGDKLIGLKKISEIFLPDRRKKREMKYEFLEIKEQSVEESIKNCV